MANIQRMTPKRLGEIFTHSGLISNDQLQEALEDQTKTGKHLGELLVERGYVTERDVAEAIAAQFSLPYLSPSQYFVSSEMTKMIPLELMQKHRMVPIDRLGKILMVVIAGPVENQVLERIEMDTDSTLQIYVGALSDVDAAIEKLAETTQKSRETRVDVPGVSDVPDVPDV